MDFGSVNFLGPVRQTANTGIQVGSGTTANRGTPAAGIIRYNTDLSRFEIYGTSWSNIGQGDGSVTSVNLVSGSNGVTVTGSPITSTGTYTVSLNTELAGLSGLSTNGIITRTGAGSYTTTSVVPVANGGTGANTATNARTALGAAGVYRTSFTNANLTANALTVSHGLGQKYVGVIIADNTDRVILPDEVTFTSNTVTTVDLTSYAPLTGTWNVTVFG